MTDLVLCDTSVIVGVLRRHEPTAKMLEALGHQRVALSVITVMELYKGARDKPQLHILVKALRQYPHVPVDVQVSSLALVYIETYHLSHGLTLPDALIAATACRANLPLFTLNTKDFRYIPEVQLYLPGGA